MSSKLQTISTNPWFMGFSFTILIILVISISYLMLRHLIKKTKKLINSKNTIFNTPHSLAYNSSEALYATPENFNVLSKINSNITYSLNTWFHIESSKDHTTLKHLFTVGGISRPCTKLNPCNTFEAVEDHRPSVWLDGTTNSLYIMFSNLKRDNMLSNISQLTKIVNPKSSTKGLMIYNNKTLPNWDNLKNTIDKNIGISVFTNRKSIHTTFPYHCTLGKTSNRKDYYYLFPRIIGLLAMISSKTYFEELCDSFQNSSDYFSDYDEYVNSIFTDHSNHDDDSSHHESNSAINHSDTLNNTSFANVLQFMIQCIQTRISNETTILHKIQKNIQLIIQTDYKEKKNIFGILILMYISKSLYNNHNPDVVPGTNQKLNMNTLPSYHKNSPLYKLDINKTFQTDGEISNLNLVNQILEIIGIYIVKIENIPLRQWFMFSILAHNHSAEILINGKIIKSIILPTNFYLSNDHLSKNRYLFVGLQDLTQSENSFKGQITNFNYYNRIISSQELEELYKIGPKKGIITKLKSKLESLEQFFILSSFDHSSHIIRGKHLGNYLGNKLKINSRKNIDIVHKTLGE